MVSRRCCERRLAPILRISFLLRVRHKLLNFDLHANILAICSRCKTHRILVMNVIMPTAMSTMHNEEELRKSSAKTAKRGLSVLATMAGEHPSVKSNAEAILDVAVGNKREDGDSTPIEYWTSFFDKWGYKDEQKKDISESMSIFLSSNYDK
mmetsp:Transcript_30682/g.73618  ORF Transcript_30682/g.73618 Transcript_30682/m.73618 type:complete len:152 (+) Transcript_30682:373-828(+)